MPTYEPKADHRPPRWNKEEKSRWIIPEQEEELIFSEGYNKRWEHNKFIWSLKFENNAPLVIGEDHRSKYVKKGTTHTNLVVARFVEHGEDHWHGYPVNVITDPPPSIILQIWATSLGVMKKSIYKLNKGIR